MLGRLKKVVSLVERLNPLIRWLHKVNIGILFLWICFTFADVVLRYVFNHAVTGSKEYSEMVMVVLVFFSLAYTQLEKSHLSVDIITSHLSPKPAIMVSVATYALCIGAVGVLIWQSIINVLSFINLGTQTATLAIPLFPFAVIISVGCALFLVVFLRDLLNAIIEGLRLGLRGWEWFLTFAIPVVVMGLLAMWMILPGLEPGMVAIISIVVVFALVFFGMPIAIALAIVAIVFVGHLSGLGPGLRMAGPVLFYQSASYTWSVIVLFIVMGYFIVVSGLGARAYDVAYKWGGHLPGGLAIATIGGSAAMAAVMGTPTAAGIAIGTVAFPEMRKRNYSERLASSVIVSGASLGPIIPPSVPLIIYGILSQTSIGKLFIAGIIPGLLLAIAFIMVVLLSCLFNPQLGPRGERTSWSARLSSLPAGIPIILLFLIILGGIYMGLFTAMEGGGIGAFMAFIIALSMGHLNWQKFTFALSEGLKFSVMLIFVLTCAMLIANFIGMSQLGIFLGDIIIGMGLSPFAFMIIILLICLALGTIMDAPIIAVLIIPTTYPIAQQLGIDLIHYGLVLTLAMNLGMMTPPYAMLIFTVRRAVCPDVSLGTIFRGIIPYCIITIVVIMLVIFFPQIVTWLPSLM